jgi:hypothetical protein
MNFKLVSTAHHIVAQIRDDLLERKGLKQEWAQIDQATQEEIDHKWTKIVYRELLKLSQ